MITIENLRNMLHYLGFEEFENESSKYLAGYEAHLRVDFNK